MVFPLSGPPRDHGSESRGRSPAGRRTSGSGAQAPGCPKGGSTEKTRNDILNAAERLFADRGYDGTSIRDVAPAAEVLINAVGYHFGLKEVLFNTVVARRAAIMDALRL